MSKNVKLVDKDQISNSDINIPEIKEWTGNNKYPAMFINTKNNKTRMWLCWVVKDKVYQTDGFIDGKIKEPQFHCYKGNTLRTGEEQAPLEADKKWLKVFDKGYIPDHRDEYGQKIYNHVKQQKEQNGGMNRGVKLFSETEITNKTTAGKKNLDTQHRPMLAKKYKDWIKTKTPKTKTPKTNEDENLSFDLTVPGKNIKFPAIVQAKVDGIRALPQLVDNSVILESRNGNNFVHLEHLKNEIKRWLEYKGQPNLILDGEMYIHRLYKNKDGTRSITNDYEENECVTPEDITKWFKAGIDELRTQAKKYGIEVDNKNKIQLRDNLENLISEVKSVERYQFISETCKITRSNPHQKEKLVQYWIFDIWDPTKTNMERYKMLCDLFKDYDGDILKLVPTKIVNDHIEIENFMKEFVGESNG